MPSIKGEDFHVVGSPYVNLVQQAQYRSPWGFIQGSVLHGGSRRVLRLELWRYEGNYRVEVVGD